MKETQRITPQPRRWAAIAVISLILGCLLLVYLGILPKKQPAGSVPTDAAPGAGSVPAAAIDPTELDPDLDNPEANLLLKLNHPSRPPRRDLELLRDALAGLRQGADRPLPPIGHSRDLARVLGGRNPQGLVLLPADHPALDPKTGEILDRWGTPYWIHPLGDGRFSFRSAGPDRRLFNEDDVVLEAKVSR